MKKLFSTLVLIFLAASGVLSAQKPANIDSLDSSKYITVDEVKPGMQAYCLTIFEGTEIEKFELEVLTVVPNFRTGMDAILVKGLDERFIHTGPVGGCRDLRIPHQWGWRHGFKGGCGEDPRIRPL